MASYCNSVTVHRFFTYTWIVFTKYVFDGVLYYICCLDTTGLKSVKALCPICCSLRLPDDDLPKKIGMVDLDSSNLGRIAIMRTAKITRPAFDFEFSSHILDSVTTVTTMTVLPRFLDLIRCIFLIFRFQIHHHQLSQQFPHTLLLDGSN